MSEVDSRLERILNGEDVEPLSVIEALIKQKMQGGNGQSGSGTNNYNQLSNKPKINGVELSGNKSSDDFNLASIDHLNEALAAAGGSTVEVFRINTTWGGDGNVWDTLWAWETGSYTEVAQAIINGKSVFLIVDGGEGSDFGWNEARSRIYTLSQVLNGGMLDQSLNTWVSNNVPIVFSWVGIESRWNGVETTDGVELSTFVITTDTIRCIEGRKQIEVEITNLEAKVAALEARIAALEGA